MHELVIILLPWYHTSLNSAPYSSGLCGMEDRNKTVIKNLVKIPEGLGDVWLSKYLSNSKSKCLGSVYVTILNYIGIS